MEKELVECAAVHAVCVGRNRGLLGEDDLSGDGWVDGEHAPVHEPAITKIRVIDFLRRPFQNFVYDVFGGLGLGFVYKELDGSSQKCQLNLAWRLEKAVIVGRGKETNLDRFIHEPKRQIVHQLIGILNSISELPNDPHHSSLALRFIQCV